MSSKKNKKKSNKEIKIVFELFENEPDESLLIDGEADIKIANLAFSNIDFSKYNGLAKRELSEIKIFGKDWATKDNAILVDPIGKQPCYDNVFFKGKIPHDNLPAFISNYSFHINE